MITEDLLTKWAALHDQPKSLFGWPDWRTLPPKRLKDAAFKLESHIAEEQVLVVTLADEKMNTMEDLQLRIFVRKERLDADVTAILEVGYNDWTCISRMDFWPSAPHINKHWRKLGQPSRVTGCHHHRFHDNKLIGPDAFKPIGNLDSAVNFDSEPTSFRDILSLIEREWHIDGASSLPPPELQGSML